MISKIVARNAMWYGIETVANLVLTLFTSIALARAVGPADLGRFIFVMWLLNATGSIGSFGIPTTTRRYIGEYLGRGQLAIVKAVFSATMRSQTYVAIAATVLSGLVVVATAEPGFRWIYLMMSLSVLPSMMNAVAAQANAGLEDLAANVPASLVSTGLFVTFVLLSVLCGWGLTGVAIGILTMRTVELVVRLIPLRRLLAAYPDEPLPSDIKTRMFHFSGHSLVLVVLNLVVWDRSELFFLKALCHDVRQVAFYSVAFNVTERLLVLSQVLGSAVATSVLVQYGRDESRLPSMVSIATRYLGLIAPAVHLGVAALAAPIMMVTYGGQYSGAIPALIVSAIFGIPKAFVTPVMSLFQGYERQDLLIRVGIGAGIVNVGLDLLLIGKYGAVGASIANGVTQTLSAGFLWFLATRLFKIHIPVGFLGKALVLAVAMATLTKVLTLRLPPLLAAGVGVIVGTFSYCLLLRVTRLLDGQDHDRLSQFRKHIPAKLRPSFDAGLGFLVASAKVATAA